MVINKILHTFQLGDVDDPEIYAAQSLWEWEQSEVGQWCMKNCVDTPTYTISMDITQYGYRVTISGNLREHDNTYFMLKYCNANK